MPAQRKKGVFPLLSVRLRQPEQSRLAQTVEQLVEPCNDVVRTRLRLLPMPLLPDLHRRGRSGRWRRLRLLHLRGRSGRSVPGSPAVPEDPECLSAPLAPSVPFLLAVRADPEVREVREVPSGPVGRCPSPHRTRAPASVRSDVPSCRSSPVDRSCRSSLPSDLPENSGSSVYAEGGSAVRPCAAKYRRVGAPLPPTAAHECCPFIPKHRLAWGLPICPSRRTSRVPAHKHRRSHQ